MITFINIGGLILYIIANKHMIAHDLHGGQMKVAEKVCQYRQNGGGLYHYEAEAEHTCQLYDPSNARFIQSCTVDGCVPEP